MEKLLAMMLLISLMTVSCNKSGGGSSEESTATPSAETPVIGDDGQDPPDPVTPDPVVTDPTPTPVPDPVSTVPALALSYKTNVTYLSGFDAADEAKYNQAVAIVKKVVATEAFRTAVLNHTYEGVKTFVQNNGLTNEEIYQDILEAAETLQPAKNNTMDVGVKLYYEASSTVGYTSSGVTYINVNTKFFDTYKPNSVAGNLFHEWLHKLGYSHDSASTSRRPYSVPYAIGRMIGTIGAKFL